MAASRNRPLAKTDLLETLRQQLAQAVQPHEIVCVAFSGGCDSVALLDALSHLLPPARLQAHHVHHGISPVADDWAVFCRDFAAARGLACRISRVDVERDAPDGLEAAARRARYQALAEGAPAVLALAHHRDDQVETVLFKLLRGSGIKGLSGMPAMRPLQAGQPDGPRVWRPLLGVPRQVLRDYAQANGLHWVEDESNANLRFARNRLRQTVLPVLREQFPALDQTLCRVADQAAEAAALLAERAMEDLQTLRCEHEGVLSLAAWQTLSPARQRNVLRHWLQQANWPMPEQRTLLAWQTQLLAVDADATVHLTYPAGACRVWRGKMYRVPHAVVPEQSSCWKGEAQLAWAGSVVEFAQRVGGLQAATVDRISARRLADARAAGLDVTLRPRVGGEQLQPAANRPNRPLRKWLQEYDIAPWARDVLPLLWVGEELVACPGVGVAATWQPQAGEDCWEMVWHGLA